MNDRFSGVFTSPTTTGLITAPGMSIGSTNTNVANLAFTYLVNGVTCSKAAVAAGTAPTATAIPAGKFGFFGFKINAAGTISANDAPDNAAGYGTAGLALAAIPAVGAGFVYLGGVLVQAKTTGAFTGATDDLVAGSDCVSAVFVNGGELYPGYNINIGFKPSKISVMNRAKGFSLEWNDSMANDVSFASRAAARVLSQPLSYIGSTPANVANGEFWFEINGVRYYKAATAAGTAPTATTIPNGKWGLFGFEIGADGTIDKKDAAANATGYASEALALAALPAASAAHTLFMYVTVSRANAAGFVGATTSFADAQTTANYYGISPSLSAYGITPADEKGTRGVRLDWNNEIFVPGDTIEWEAFR
jgi:hypothetical protein